MTTYSLLIFSLYFSIDLITCTFHDLFEVKEMIKNSIGVQYRTARNMQFNKCSSNGYFLPVFFLFQKLMKSVEN